MSELTARYTSPLTHVRYKVVAFTMTLAAVTYLDRVCISIVAPSIMRDLKLSQIQMGYVFSAFTLAYAIFEIPTARWADRIGSRKVLTRIVLWWSAFTMATAGAFSYVALLVIRFLFGIGEAGAWPNAARVFARWIPATGTRPCSGNVLCRGSSVGRPDAYVRRLSCDLFELANHLPPSRFGRSVLGRRLVFLVSR